MSNNAPTDDNCRTKLLSGIDRPALPTTGVHHSCAALLSRINRSEMSNNAPPNDGCPGLLPGLHGPALSEAGIDDSSVEMLSGLERSAMPDNSTASDHNAASGANDNARPTLLSRFNGSALPDDSSADTTNDTGPPMLPRIYGPALPNNASSDDNNTRAMLPGIARSSLPTAILHYHTVFVLPGITGPELSATVQTQ